MAPLLLKKAYQIPERRGVASVARNQRSRQRGFLASVGRASGYCVLRSHYCTFGVL